MLIDEDELSADGRVSAYKTLIKRQRESIKPFDIVKLREGDRIKYLWSRVRTVYLMVRFYDILRKNKEQNEDLRENY